MSKLPKWAQRRIEQLERKVEHLEEKLTHDEHDSNTFAEPYLVYSTERDNHGIPLGRDTQVRVFFDPDPKVVGGDKPFRRYVEMRMVEATRNSKQHVRISASDGMLVRPASSNLIEVKLEERYVR